MDETLMAKIKEIVDKAKADPKFMDELKADPEKTLENLIGTELPDGMMKPLVEGVKAHLDSGELGNIIGKLEGLFGGK